VVTLTLNTRRDDHIIAWLAALAIAVHLLESVLPSPFPGFKPGLANIVTIIVLCRYGIKMAVWVSLLRVLIGSILLGTFMSPTFVLSFSGALASLAALYCVFKLGQFYPLWAPGAVGYSVLAATSHISAQFFIAYYLFIQHDALFNLLPVLLTTSLIFGMLSGLIINSVLVKLGSADDK